MYERMSDETMTREEMIKEMLEKFSLLLSIKYSDDTDVVIDRELELLRTQLGACGYNDLSNIENKYKN